VYRSVAKEYSEESAVNGQPNAMAVISACPFYHGIFVRNICLLLSRLVFVDMLVLPVYISASLFLIQS
jgi:hypothetical protein